MSNADYLKGLREAAEICNDTEALGRSVWSAEHRIRARIAELELELADEDIMLPGIPDKFAEANTDLVRYARAYAIEAVKLNAKQPESESSLRERFERAAADFLIGMHGAFITRGAAWEICKRMAEGE